eukprot:COSAG06_NODE_7059_length_2652_cov_3.164904_4_plen_109_part_00
MRFAAQVRLVPDSPDGSEDGQQRKVRRDLLETSAASTMDGSGGGGGSSSMVVPEPEPEPDEGCETQTNADAFPTSVFCGTVSNFNSTMAADISQDKLRTKERRTSFDT